MDSQRLELDLHRLELRFAGSRLVEPRAVNIGRAIPITPIATVLSSGDATAADVRRVLQRLAMAIRPGALRLTLIGAVVGITVQLAELPTAPALTLTGRQGAITLMWNLRTRPECSVACRAPPALHGMRLRTQKAPSLSNPVSR